MTNREYQAPKALIGLTIFILAFIYFYWIAANVLQPFGDEGIYLEGGRRIALGQQPYRDFFVLTGPLTFWIEGALAYLSASKLAWMRLPMVLDVAFLAWAVYWFISRYAGTLYSVGAAFVFAAYESRIRLLNVNHRWDSAALATAAIVFGLAGERSRTRRPWFLSGVLAAAAGWATPSLLIVAIPLLWWSARRNARDAVAFAGGAALLSAAAALYLQWNHALGPMILSLRWTGANYTAPNRVPYGSVWAGVDPHLPMWQYVAFTAFSMIPAILPPAAIAAFAYFWRPQQRRTEMVELVPLVAGAAALTLAAWPRWSSDTLLHTMAVPWFLCALLLYRLTNSRTRLWWCGPLLLAASVSLASNVWAQFNYTPRETRVGTVYDPADEGDVLEGLERWIQPGDTLFSFPYLPAAYYFLSASNPTHYSFLQPGMMNEEDEQSAVEELQSNPPHWVIYENFPPEAVLRIWPGSDPARIPMTRMNAYLSVHYRPVETIAGSRSRLVVMERVVAIP